MQRLVTGIFREKGFTLIEILIVLLILSICLCCTLFAFGDLGSNRQVLITAEQFCAHLKLARQKAILENTNLAIKVTGQGYQIYHLVRGRWQLKPGISLFRWHRFPASVVVSSPSSQKQESTLYFRANGDITPFVLNFGTIKQSHLMTLTDKPKDNSRYETMQSSCSVMLI